jgi:hypothetical protein
MDSDQVALTEVVLQKIKRIHRLSERPPNPGYAYRHLEHIRALTESLIQEIERRTPPSN